MTLKIIHKNNTSAGQAPASSDLDIGEIAVNSADAKLYIEDNNGAVQSFTNDNDAATVQRFTQAGTGAVQRTVESKLQESVSVLDFGADPTGAVSSYQAFENAINSGYNVLVPPGTYTGVGGHTINRDNFVLDLTSAILQQGSSTVFLYVGPNNTSPQIRNITIRGGEWQGPNDGTDKRFVYVRAAENTIIDGCTLRYVGNGGITVAAGSNKTTIQNCRVLDGGGASTIRGIWVSGSNAPGYASNYVDTATLTRNATAFPTVQAERVTISNCEVAVGTYGIYSMNSNYLTVTNCYIHSFGAARGITLNTYSHNAIISNNLIEGSGTSSGILVTQASDGVVISNNIFKGNYGGGRQIQVQYLAKAIIESNHFLGNGTQAIDINTGSTATIINNNFVRPSVSTSSERAIYVLPVDRNVVSDPTKDLGQSATTVPGVIVKDNTFENWAVGLLVRGQLLLNDNSPGFEASVFANNVFTSLDPSTLVAYSGPCAFSTPDQSNVGGGTNGTNYNEIYYRNNIVKPRDYAYRNVLNTIGDTSDQNLFYADQTLYLSRVLVKATSATTTEVTYSAGAEFAVTATNSISGGGFRVTPRNPAGSIAQDVPTLVSVSQLPDGDPWFASYRLVPESPVQNNTYRIIFYDSSGNELDTRQSAQFNKVAVLHFASRRGG